MYLLQKKGEDYMELMKTGTCEDYYNFLCEVNKGEEGLGSWRPGSSYCINPGND